MVPNDATATAATWHPNPRSADPSEANIQLAALGSMPLTAYSAHVVLILVIAGPGGGLHSMAAWLWMGLGLILACTVWALYRGRGPLETITARSARAMAAGTENITTAG
ncbi:putative membrane protein YeiB [Brachybacterium muris]|uniref:hypothetical protein n=1 Tax=Brachybacterium muris TaxID=219301 RepID=UPI00195ABF1B|nr:hypothetical protein [Brachybacterium muris]MBM7501839.1 putative membrane protein YeiB [Brachybacterium muris]